MLSSLRHRSIPVCLVLALITTITISPALWADEPILKGDRLEYPEGVIVPRNLTEVEREYLEIHPIAPFRGRSTPPSGPVHCPAEYEPMGGILIAWEGFSTIQVQMAREITTTGDADLYVVLDSSSEQSSAASVLSAGGVDMSRVHYVVRTTDSVWIRDYGPRYIYEGQCRAIVDHTYNRPRYNDNDFPVGFSSYMNHAYYEIPLTHGGGNFHLDALGQGYATRLINNENPSLTEAQILAHWFNFQNLNVNLFTPFPTSVDSTQHIDMWVQVVGDNKVIVSDWPHQSGTTQDQICDNAASWFASRGFTVYRPPARTYGGTHYTFTNVVMCNDLVLIPSYTSVGVSSYNGTARAVWQNACPDKTIVQIPCEDIVGYAGVMHCIVMHIPRHLGGVNPTAYQKNLRGGETLNGNSTVEIRWISDDDEAVANVDLLLSTDGGNTYPTTIASATADDGSFMWTVPGNVNTGKGRIRVVTRDYDGHIGYDESDTDIIIGTPPCDGNRDGQVNLADYGILAECLFGPEISPDPASPYTESQCLLAYDLDDDGDVDLEDFGEFAAVLGNQ